MFVFLASSVALWHTVNVYCFTGLMNERNSWHFYSVKRIFVEGVDVWLFVLSSANFIDVSTGDPHCGGETHVYAKLGCGSCCLLLHLPAAKVPWPDGAVVSTDSTLACGFLIE